MQVSKMLIIYLKQYISDIELSIEMDRIKFKVVILGQPGSGKSCFIQKLTSNTYNPNYVKTQSYQLSKFQFINNTSKYQIQLWDAGTQHMSYNKPTRGAFFRHTSAAFIMFDLCDKNWQKNVEMWMEQAYRFQCYLVYAIGTKKDLLFRNSLEDNNRNEIHKKLMYKEHEQRFEEFGFQLNQFFKNIEIKHFYQSCTQKISYEIKSIFVGIYDDRQKLTRSSIARGIRFDGSVVEEYIAKMIQKEQDKNLQILNNSYGAGQEIDSFNSTQDKISPQIKPPQQSKIQ